MKQTTFLDAQARELNVNNELIRRAQQHAYESGDAPYVHFAFTLPKDREFYQSLHRRCAKETFTLYADDHLFILKECQPRGIYGGRNGVSRYICQHHGEELIAGWVEC